MAMRTKLAVVGACVGTAALGFMAGLRFSATTQDVVVTPVALNEVIPQEAIPQDTPTPTTDPPSGKVQAEPKPRILTSLREILQLQSDFAQTTALYLLASRSNVKGIEDLLQQADALMQENDRAAATSILYSRLGELDPEAAVERILRTDGLELRYLSTVFRAWARGDWQQALARAERLEDQRGKAVAVQAILLADTNLPQAQRAALASKYELRAAASNRGPRPDFSTPESAQRSWRDALAVTDPMARSSRLGQLAYLWAKRSPEAALQAIEQLDDLEQRRQLLFQSMTAWAEKSPREAYEWAQQRRPSPERSTLVDVALYGLAKQQPQAALELAERLTRSEQRTAVPQLMQLWAASDLPAAMAYLDSIKDPTLRASAVQTIADVYTRKNAEEAFRWVATLPPGDSQAVVTNIISNIADKDPLRASSLANGLPEGAERDAALYSVGARWGTRDAPAAFAWAMRSVNGKIRNNVVAAVLNSWATYDPAGATQQVLQLTDTALRDLAATSLLYNYELESTLAEQLYSRIESAKVRGNVASQLYLRLRDTDPALAERYRRDVPAEQGMPVVTPMGR